VGVEEEVVIPYLCPPGQVGDDAAKIKAEKDEDDE
jgi:hypothetical protein